MHYRARLVVFLLALSALFVSTTPAAAVWGVPDVVPAATLVVPYFETGVNAGTHPHDTLLAVHATADVTFHYEIWNIDGERMASGRGNVGLNNGRTWSQAMRNRIAGMTDADKLKMQDGDFYRGFVTIDVVSTTTDLSPFDASYPWAFTEGLTGSVYYTRLSEGSANGLPMIHLEAVSASANASLEGFYSKASQGHPADRREEIDADARVCSSQLSEGLPCSGDSDGDVDEIRARVFRESSLNGSTRLVVFAWNTFAPTAGGPSIQCQSLACDTEYPLRWFQPDGNLGQFLSNYRLEHVVNVYELEGASGSGQALIQDIPNVDLQTQVYAFAFNSAKPAGGAALNWDAIFEALIKGD